MAVQIAAAPDFVWQLLDWTARAGDVVIIEWQTTRIVNGARFLNWRGVDKFRLAAGKIIEERVYCDTAPFTRASHRRGVGADHQILKMRPYQSADLVEILGRCTRHSSSISRRRWQQVRHHDGHHAGAGRGPHARYRNPPGQRRVSGSIPSRSARFQKGLRMRFAKRIIAARNDRLEIGRAGPCAPEVTLARLRVAMTWRWARGRQVSSRKSSSSTTPAFRQRPQIRRSRNAALRRPSRSRRNRTVFP